MFYNKENEEVKKFLEKERKLAPERLISQIKKMWAPVDKDDEKFYTERALKYFDDFYEKEDFRNHTPRYQNFDLTPFISELRTFNDDIERAYTIAINKEDGSLFEYIKHYDANEISERMAEEIYSFMINVSKKYDKNKIGIILMHSHPTKAIAKASMPDIFAFMKMFLFARDLGIEMLDSFVVARYDIYSEAQEDANRDEGQKLLPPKILSKEKIKQLEEIDPRSALLMRLYKKKAAIVI